MKRRDAIGSIVSGLLLSGCEESMRAQRQKEGKGMMELRLERVPGDTVRLRATLSNGTAQTVELAAVPQLQPVLLRVMGSSGNPAKPFDQRFIQKFDTRVTAGSYARVEPGGTLVLEEGFFKAGAGRYSLAWGPFRFSNILAGDYRLQASWESRIDWIDQDGKAPPRTGPVWKGQLHSAEITIQLSPL